MNRELRRRLDALESRAEPAPAEGAKAELLRRLEAMEVPEVSAEEAEATAAEARAWLAEHYGKPSATP